MPDPTLKTAMGLCANCDANLSGPFCGQCGQSAVDLNQSVWRLLVESVEEAIGVEGRLSRTLRLLAVRPGQLTAEYLAGRRARYTSPVRLYLLASAAFFVVFRLTRGIDQAYYGYSGSAGVSYYDALAKVFIALLPASTLVLGAAYIGSRRYSLHHLVFSLHTGAAALFWALALTLTAFGFKIVWQHHSNAPAWLPDFVFWLYLPAVAVFLAYVVVALRRTYGSSWVGSTLRATAIGVSMAVGFYVLLPFISHLQSLL